jgi:pimeloyl-ACP methyl ester carboxylesterase
MGDSDRRPQYLRRQFARELLRVADHAGFGALTIVAHSFGGLSGLYACRLAPDRITRAIIIDAYVFRPERDVPFESRPERFYPSREAAEARFRLGPPGMWPDPDVLAYIAHHSVVEKPQGWTWKFDPLGRKSIDSEKDLRAELRDLTTPVDFIHGDRSEVVDADALASLVANMPSCGTPIAIPLCHHHVMIEQPFALVAVLDALLANPRSGAPR